MFGFKVAASMKCIVFEVASQLHLILFVFPVASDLKCFVFKVAAAVKCILDFYESIFHKASWRPPKGSQMVKPTLSLEPGSGPVVRTLVAAKYA